MSWPILLPTLAVGFVLGVVWHRAHIKERNRNILRHSAGRFITREVVKRG